MTDTMSDSLARATSEENDAVKAFDALVAAKTKEINALTKAVESKTARIGDLGVQLVTLKEDLDDTTKSLGEDEAFLKDLDNQSPRNRGTSCTGAIGSETSQRSRQLR